MTKAEVWVIQCAIDFVDAQRAIDHGCPGGEMKRKAETALITAVNDLADENDGRWDGPAPTPLETILRRIRGAGLTVNNCFQLPSGVFRASLRDDTHGYSFAEHSDPVEALRLALARRGSGKQLNRGKTALPSLDIGKLAAELLGD